MSAALNGAEALCAALVEAGIEAVFGVPGTQTVPFYEALRRSGLRTITATQELAACFMAQGYFRASGRLAAVSTIPGPGFSFALAAVPEAYLDGAGLVLLTGAPPLCPRGRRRSQAIDQAAMARPVIKAVIDATSAACIKDAVRRACRLARHGEPGPVLLQVATGALTESMSCDMPAPDAEVAEQSYETKIDDAAVKFCAAAKRPFFYVGQGALDAVVELRRAVEALGAVVATTPSGRGALPEDDERVLPLDATGDVDAVNGIIAACDVVVVLGAALSEAGTLDFRLKLPPERLVRVDVSTAVLALPPQARYSVQSTSRAFLQALLAQLHKDGSAPRGFNRAQAQQLRARLQDRRCGGPSDARIGGGTAKEFFTALRRAIPVDGCLVVDSGMHQLLARRHFIVLQPRSLLFPTDFQSMAFALPAAIGVKLARPQAPVVALLGDGGFAISGMELRTAVAHRLALPVIVLADGALGLIRLEQLLTHGHAYATELSPFDYAAMADAVGCAYAHATGADIETHVRAAFDRSSPTLIAVAVGDAPALRHALQRRRLHRMLRAMLGERLLQTARKLRGRS
ncbi:MAG: thiamine pyrophosphate-binding protein [Burkholderiaceae bacterium]|nr:thiamine pyrophosphate-binding protein [Burkholderiaceae bacterium]